jgi:two-component system chemotaxis response regulator CheY
LARKILLADDSVTAQNMGRKILADAGYEVITVNNGSAALKKIAEQKPDLIILDVYMPGYSGLEVCQRLKEAAETARTPVLLTVGKLEPFKPEEAKRVRAEGFIVKPFEASELLSVLSKLEDKIVHRAEPSKPGRFARAVAAVEYGDRPGGPRSANKETGWEKRIAFPPKKSKSAEKEDDSETYNSVTPDLRDILEKDERRKEERRKEDSKPAEDRLRGAAIAPADLPKDVTPEELAALAAAAAQVQAKLAAADLEKAHAEADRTAITDGVAKTKANSEGGEGARASRRSAANWDAPGPASPEAKAEEAESSRESAGATFAGGAHEEIADAPPPSGDQYRKDPPSDIAGSDAEVMAAIAALEPANGKAWDTASSTHETEKAAENLSPVAATAEAFTTVTGPRWTAVPVATNADEATLSLEHEMHKAYAAFAAADAGYSTLVSSVPVGPSIATPKSGEEIETARTAAEESAPASSAEQTSPSAAMPPVPATDTALPVHENAHETTAQAAPEMPQTVESQPATQIAETAPPEESAGHAIAEAEDASATNRFESAYVPELASTVAELTAGWNNSDDSGTQETAQKKDSELAATTAAAWASWRQIRETSDSGTSENPERAKDFEVENPPAPERESAALAVAAGAEKNPEESCAADSADEARNIASLVDSVMAELRPKIVAEISKKLASGKK